MTPLGTLGTVNEVSECLQIPVATLYQWRRRKIGPKASKVGRHLRYQWQDVQEWLAEQAEVAA